MPCCCVCCDIGCLFGRRMRLRCCSCLSSVWRRGRWWSKASKQEHQTQHAYVRHVGIQRLRARTLSMPQGHLPECCWLFSEKNGERGRWYVWCVWASELNICCM